MSYLGHILQLRPHPCICVIRGVRNPQPSKFKACCIDYIIGTGVLERDNAPPEGGTTG